MDWAWSKGDQVLEMPDQHPRRETAYNIGMPLNQMAIWVPNMCPYQQHLRPACASAARG